MQTETKSLVYILILISIAALIGWHFMSLNKEIQSDDTAPVTKLLRNQNNLQDVENISLQKEFAEQIEDPQSHNNDPLEDTLVTECAENIEDSITFRSGFATHINDKEFEKMWECERSKEPCQDCYRSDKSCNEEILKEEKESMLKEINSKQFNIIDGCIYKDKKRLLKNNLYYYLNETDFFAGKKLENTHPMPESIDEWFRIEDKNNLHIYLYGSAGCGGCIFNDYYLKIDKKSGSIKGKIVDLPYIKNLFLSPDNRFAVEVDYELNKEGRSGEVHLWLYEFISNERKKLLYKIPENKTILTEGDGIYTMDVIEWKNNTKISVQLYENDKDSGFAKFEYVETNGISSMDYIESGDPLLIEIE